MKILRHYQTDNGKTPFIEWLTDLRDVIGISKINRRLDRLTHGQYGDSASIGEGVFELRIHYGPGYRIYYAEHSQEVVILLHGGSKGTQQRDIDRAINYWKDYLERYYGKSNY